jgi:methionyl-tRNA formyltransferase
LTRPVQGEELLVDWRWSAERICNHIRAYADKPLARGWLFGERVKLVAAEPASAELATVVRAKAGDEPGAIFVFSKPDPERLTVVCDGGAVVITKVIPPGRNPQTGAEFARRHRTESQ